MIRRFDRRFRSRAIVRLPDLSGLDDQGGLWLAGLIFLVAAILSVIARVAA